VLVPVRAAAVNIGDWHLLRGVPYVMRVVTGLRKPRRVIRGLDIAGRVESVGRNVRQCRRAMRCSAGAGGAFAEYASAGETPSCPTPPTSR
jgi:NADPH:quinone reductase-like Zn-dependent oxidoreductase